MVLLPLPWFWSPYVLSSRHPHLPFAPVRWEDTRRSLGHRGKDSCSPSLRRFSRLQRGVLRSVGKGHRGPNTYHFLTTFVARSRFATAENEQPSYKIGIFITQRISPTLCAAVNLTSLSELPFENFGEIFRRNLCTPRARLLETGKNHSNNVYQIEIAWGASTRDVVNFIGDAGSIAIK